MPGMDFHHSDYVPSEAHWVGHLARHSPTPVERDARPTREYNFRNTGKGRVNGYHKGEVKDVKVRRL